MIRNLRMPFIAGLISIFIIAIAVIIGWRILNGDARLLRDVEVQHTVLTPNADGDNDVTRISYEISRNATVSIYFENEEGERFYFRENKRRGSGEYEVLFSGVVQGFLLEDEEIDGDILNRLLKDGDYRWVIEAEDEQGVIEQSNGSLQIVDADPILPEVRNFTIHPISKLFTPNRDGIDDRVKPQFFLPKDVEELRVFLEMPDGTEFPITELERDVPATEEGMHIFDWDGGVDDGATPPPDGTYPLVVMSRDAEGQRIRLEDELTIQFGGVPRADIFSPPTGETLSFDATAVLLCDTLEFTLTVRNYGTTPVRTSGPAPGTIYDSTWNYNTVGWPTESGVFRVGIGFENELSPYPYRWAVGAESDLQKIGDSYYLMPGERAVVTGGIRVIDEFGVRNPQPMWAGLIHEDVEISQFNRNVDPHAILIDIPDESNIETCEARNIPSRAEE